MFFKDVLSGANYLLTWFAQLSVAFVLAWAVCGLIASPRVKTWIWNAFILGSIVSWVLAVFDATAPITPDVTLATVPSAALAPAPAHSAAEILTWSWTINPQWTFRLQVIAQQIAYIYLIVAAVLVVRWMWHSHRLRVVLREAKPPAANISQLFSTLCRQFHVCNCQLVTVPNLHSPATARWWRPRVVIPTDLVSQVDHGQLLDMLRHELVHVRRRDYLWDRIATFACSLMFFHPVLWLAYRELRRQRELACDHAVAGCEPDSRLRYADSLLSLARWRHTKSGPRAAIGFSAATSPLGNRIHALISPPTYSFKANRTFSGLIVTVAVLASFAILPAVGITFYRAVQQQFVETSPAEITVAEPIVASQTKSRHEHAVLAPSTSTAFSSNVAIPDPHEIPITMASLSPTILPNIPAQPALVSQQSAPKHAWPKMSDILRTDQRPIQPNWTAPRFAASVSKQRTPISGLRKTLASAAIYGVTYLAHETGEDFTEH
jgi:beta-lactamase regulating signal transducer with metallopeptidase domain